MQGTAHMKQNRFLYNGQLLRDISKEIERETTINRKNAAHVIRNDIRKEALAVKKTGNLARGVYEKHDKTVSFVGIHAPGFQNFLIEFGHFAGKRAHQPGTLTKVVIGTSKRGHDITRTKRIGGADLPDGRKFVPAHPIVYPAFERRAAECIAIMSQEILAK
jgi:hypothetical protein